MAAPWTNIKRKAEDCVAGLIDTTAGANITALTAFKGISGSELTSPRYEVVAERADPEIIGDTVTGNWNVEVRVSIVTNFEDTNRATHGEYVAYIEDVLMLGDMAAFVAALNAEAISDYTVYQAFPGSQEDLVNESQHRTDTSLNVYCAPS